jgi:REP element-mobilizing transposase RayT
MKQLAIKFRTWGGKRKGAGRKPKRNRAGVPHVPRKQPRRTPAHVTMRIVGGRPSLRSNRSFRAVKEALRKGKVRFGLRVIHFSVQGNHLHLLVEAEDALALARGIKGLSVRIVRAFNKVHGLRGQVFSDRFHSRALKSPREVAYGMRYVLGNHLKHGLSSGGSDPYSSAEFAPGPNGLTVRPKFALIHITLEGRWLGLAVPWS